MDRPEDIESEPGVSGLESERRRSLVPLGALMHPRRTRREWTPEERHAVLDDLVEARSLRVEAVDDHGVFYRCSTGADLLAYFDSKRRSVPEAAVAQLDATTRPVSVREGCRLRRLVVV
jgi:hypothetical protein